MHEEIVGREHYYWTHEMWERHLAEPNCPKWRHEVMLIDYS